ncbi:hypothetical protein AF335_17205 [Streptomyces eurocidicus]|uniref:DNA-binding CsgD family transcriptional regulator n=1 Tax=Streptomyces eurocidicus TaxID=66423 RepID=A0A2N8NUA1_STREU|nr:LuxR C-terminal-related transcriptional regulator [Streptomyces eurocidicus]MBB5120196.1 DNA-binding CsgD family transcriptional regulator [Streptomyces eurocidicus]PNE32353.1 hypothetical protein AF335_17205 [Streptomyces eurocidicus]
MVDAKRAGAGGRGYAGARRGAAAPGGREGGPAADGLGDRGGERAAAEGLTNTEIAERLHISLGTVKKHLAGTQLKLDLRNRVELAAWAYRHGHMDGAPQAREHR